MRKILSVFLISFLFTVLMTCNLPGTHAQKEVNKNSITAKQIKKADVIAPKQIYAEEIKIVYAPPVNIKIPKINLDTEIVPVGLDEQNRMDVPNNFVQAGWYNLGPKAGEIGSVVVDGHHDDFSGNPAVFYYLSELVSGDEIILTDQNGKQYTYVVADNIVYPYNQLPLQSIFVSNDKPRLNLITCAGIWDGQRGDYSQRTVIYSVLKN